MMKIGRRIADGMSFLKRLMMISLIKRTNVMLSPIPIPLKTLVVTASDEQSPIERTKSGFSFTMPFVKILNGLICFLPQDSF